MNKRIRLISMLLTFCILFCGMSLVSFADDNEWGGKTSLLIDALESEDIWENLIRGTYLQKGNSKISNAGNYTVRISGGTDAYQSCDMVKAIIYLDRYEDGEWVQIYSVPFTATNTYTVNGGQNMSVLPGYYYRARGYHTVKVGSTTESCYTLSNGIWIN